jgi:3-(3-hydroxy-phenyl)propionate hydroxylase
MLFLLIVRRIRHALSPFVSGHSTQHGRRPKPHSFRVVCSVGPGRLSCRIDGFNEARKRRPPEVKSIALARMDSEDQVGGFTYAHHEPRLPALRDGVDPAPCPVAIVGGGPVGLALALGLANWGIRSVVLEADDTVCVGSRAACISRRSLEIVDRLGCLETFLAKGLAWTGGRSFYRTEEVFRFQMPHDDRQRLPPMINLQQYYIEQYLVDEIERRNRNRGEPLVDLRWASEVSRFAAAADGVDLAVHTALGDYSMRADWMVACDGGQSMVRKSLDLPLLGTAYEGRYVIIDIHLPSSHPTERRAWFDPPWNPGSTVLMHRQVDDIWRIDYQLRVGEDTETALQPENVAQFVQKHLEAIGEGHLPWRTIWTSIYRAGAMTLASYRHGRVLFAGNAAHALPIFGVRGLNSGFDDADNLAWKLALVLRESAGDALLDSYSSERIAAFHINAENAMRSTEFMSPPSRGFDLLREAALSLAAAHTGIASLINPRQTEAVPYRESPLSTPDDGSLPAAQPGYLLADFPLEEPAGHLSELLQPGFALLVFSATGTVDAVMAGAVEAIEHERRLPLQYLLVSRRPCRSVAHPDEDAVVRGNHEAAGNWIRAVAHDEVFRTHVPGGTVALLLRPDRHVAARWRLDSQASGDAFAVGLKHALRRACCATGVGEPLAATA